MFGRGRVIAAPAFFSVCGGLWRDAHSLGDARNALTYRSTIRNRHSVSQSPFTTHHSVPKSTFNTRHSVQPRCMHTTPALWYGGGKSAVAYRSATKPEPADITPGTRVGTEYVLHPKQLERAEDRVSLPLYMSGLL